MKKDKFNVDIKKLSKLNLYQLREVGSIVGVRNPTAMKTEDLRNAIKLVVSGKVEPYEKVKSGRPHNKTIISDIEWNTLVGYDTSIDYSFLNNPVDLSMLCSPLNDLNFDVNQIFDGIVTKIGNEMIIFNGDITRLNLSLNAKIDDETINGDLLRFGDYVTTSVEYRNFTLCAKQILTINSKPAETFNRQVFDLMQPEFFGEKIDFDLPQLQFINNVCPIKLGQRVLIYGEIGSGQSYLAGSLAKDLQDKYHTIFLATNKCPEEKIYLNETDYIFTTFDILPQELWLYFEIACERAKRLCEQGENVVFIIDDLIMLMQNLRNILSEKDIYVEKYYPNILLQCKKLLALSKNTQNGSLTIICTMSKCCIESFNEFINDLNELCNCHIALVREDFINGEDDFYDKNLTFTNTTREI